MKKLSVLIIASLILVIQFGCDNGKLTESKAEKILTSKSFPDMTATIQLNNLGISPYVPEELKTMQTKGLATYNFIPPGNQGYGCYGTLTEKGKQYLVGTISNEFIRMSTAKIGFDKITGILLHPEFNTAEVEYNTKIIEITPIGEMYNDLQLGKIFNNKAIFKKYEDGWRIE